MTKLAGLSFGLLTATSAFAAAMPAYVDECRTAAIEKLQAAALSQQLRFVPESVQVENIDDRRFNPVKYVWFGAEGIARSGQAMPLHTMTQKSFLPAARCF